MTAMVGGDFDGDARADVAMIVHGRVRIQFGALDDAVNCGAAYSFPDLDPTAAALAVGDYDGDGDDELGVRFGAGEVAVLDGE